ncbi:hypothetical protein Scep_005858 [Stephania cephalantha]|uniref:Non-specific lipid-transfer protein n=1 Tax=Stephania cephalantha TaxID=152367 RepID=A0AAP0KYH2_9MAGN
MDLKLSIAKLAMVALVVAAPAAEAALTCGMVASDIAPCLNYIQHGGTIPPKCCNGVKTLDDAADTTEDRRTACTCLKNLLSTNPGINLGLANSLPAKCGVSVPYPISPSTDCTKINK